MRTPVMEGEIKYSIGNYRLLRLRCTLTILKPDRSNLQKKIHEMYIKYCLPKIYQNEWKQNGDNTHILHDFNSTNEIFKPYLSLTYPQTHETLYATTMFYIALLWCVPNVDIAIFVETKRIMNDMLKIFNELTAHIINFDEYVIQKWMDGISLQFEHCGGNTDTRRLWCHSLKSNYLPKGVCADIIFIEDVISLDSDLFCEIICPLLSAPNTIMMVRTITGSTSFSDWLQKLILLCYNTPKYFNIKTILDIKTILGSVEEIQICNDKKEDNLLLAWDPDGTIREKIYQHSMLKK